MSFATDIYQNSNEIFVSLRHQPIIRTSWVLSKSMWTDSFQSNFNRSGIGDIFWDCSNNILLHFIKLIMANSATLIEIMVIMEDFFYCGCFLMAILHFFFFGIRLHWCRRVVQWQLQSFLEVQKYHERKYSTFRPPHLSVIIPHSSNKKQNDWYSHAYWSAWFQFYRICIALFSFLCVYFLLFYL